MFFSIVIPVYNVEKYLKDCVDSILAQTNTNFEMILVDDGSTDASGAICDEYAQRDTRVTVLHKENGGANSARNMGIFAAKGDYICLVDSDDRVDVKWLETIADAIDCKKPDLIVFGYSELKDGTKINIPLLFASGYYDKERLEKEIYPRLINRKERVFSGSLIFEVPWNKAYKRELIQAHCCKDETIKVNNDMAFAHECVFFANNMIAVNEFLYEYHIGVEHSLQNSYHADLLQNCKTLYLYMKGRLSELYPYINSQLNALLMVMILNVLRKELRYGYSVSKSAQHLKKQFAETGILRYINVRELTLKHKVLWLLLQMRLYRLVLILLKAKESVA